MGGDGRGAVGHHGGGISGADGAPGNGRPAGDNSQKIPPHTGLPGFSLPMGFTYDNLPAGLQIVGRLFSEPTLIEIAYGYEQSTMHRKPSEMFS